MLNAFEAFKHLPVSPCLSGATHWVYSLITSHLVCVSAALKVQLSGAM
jgi:hypothetical protein